MPQGVSADLIATKYGFSRDDVDAYAVESQKRAAKAWDEGRFDKSVVPVKDVNGLTHPRPDEHMRPDHRHAVAGRAASRPSSMMGEMGGFDAVADPGASGGRARSTTCTTPAIRRASSTARRRCWSARKEAAARRGPEAAREDPRLRQYRLGAGADADRPGRRDRKAARSAPA